MQVFPLLVLLATPLLAVLPSAASADDFETILGRQRTLLLAKPPSVAPADIQQWTRQLDAQGAWPDIDYHDLARAEWTPRHHLERVVVMLKAVLQPLSPLHGDAPITTAANRALDYWLATRPHCVNWWHNEIGTPGYMRDVLLLLGGTLNGPRQTGALEVLHQFKVGGSGANLVWSAGLAFDYGCQTKDEGLVNQSAAQLTDEIHVSNGEGIQPDFSFHQHGARLQTFHYGASYASDCARLAWLLVGTRWALPADKVQVLVDYTLKGQQWMSRWNYTVPSTIDRAVSRPGSMHVDDLAANAALLAEVDPTRRAELDECRARVSGRAPALSGFRSYPRSDFACYQRPDFSFFIKTISARTLVSEMGMNGENLKGWHLNDGATFILRKGDEYEDLAPVWDWSLLPGVTGIEGFNKVDRQTFVGAVGDGESGCVAMDYQADEEGGNGQIKARKAYFCHGDAVVCLIGGLSAQAGKGPARTALDQCLLRGPVVVADQTGAPHTLSVGETHMTSVRWIYHDGLVYAPTTPADITMRIGPVTGRWCDISASGSSANVEKSVFLPVMVHGTTAESPSAGYTICPCPSPTQAPEQIVRAACRIIRNDTACQAVRWADGTLMAAFYQPGELRDVDPSPLVVNQPCMILSHTGHIYASDPTQRGLDVRVALPAAQSLLLPTDGVSIEAHRPST